MGGLAGKEGWGLIHDFYLALRNNVTLQSLEAQTLSSPSPATISDMQELVAFHKSVIRPLLTHSDLSSFNILLRDDKIVDIIDWETAR